MSRKWTPERFITLRRIRISICVAAVFLVSILAFAIGAHKTVALEINGERKEVTTYAMSVDRLLQEQNVDIKTHDAVTSTSSELLADHAQVTVKKAYQAYVNIDGKQVPFWTVANSADQLLHFFEQNEIAATRVQVDIPNVYNKLTGGLIINHDGPVTVIADGKTSIAPNGKLTAASILDSKGIQVGKDDRVNVERDNNETILRVQRVTYGDVTNVTPIAFNTITIQDPNLEPGQQVIRQEGENGERTDTYHVTYVDGQQEDAALTSSNVTKIAVDRIIAIGPDKPKEEPKQDSQGSGNTQSNNNQSDSSGSKQDTDQNKDESKDSNQPTDNTPSNNSGNAGQNNSQNNQNQNSGSQQQPSQPEQQPTQPEQQPQQPATDPSTAGLWHPSPAQAQAYAAGAAAQYGWTGAQWDALVWLWDHESGWRWWADNPWSDAYGIPQALPGSKMGTGWQDDGAVQINWGLGYIAQRYGSPLQAKAYWLQHNWYQAVHQIKTYETEMYLIERAL